MGWDAGEYAKHSSVQQQWARELIGKLAWRGDERVLDIGCGDGKVTAEIARVAVPRGSVLGIDSSADMIGFASRQFTDVANLRFLRMNARDITLRCEFDVVFSNAALHWVVDHRPVLRGIAAALKPGGRVLLQMGGKGNAATMVETIERVAASRAWSRWFDRFAFPYGFHGTKDYDSWLRDAGFEPVRIELIPKDAAHDPQSLAGWVRTTWLPWTDRVPAEERETFIGEVVEVYIAAHPLDAQGQTHVPMVRLEVEARRPS
jgi:trans-aconitate methyltransferase